jgi:putative glycosyltransferase (TIGR04372 family)
MLDIVIKKIVKALLNFPLFLLIGIPGFIFIKLVSPWILIRLEGINCARIGHFAGNMELYCCEMDAAINRPSRKYIDLFFFNNEPICNQYLADLWKKKLTILPFWFLYPIRTFIRFVPYSKKNLIYSGHHNDRDMGNLMDRFPKHLSIDEKDKKNGTELLEKLGIPGDAKIVTLLVRDNAYLAANTSADWNYHSYRDCNVENFIPALEELTKMGYYVIRMGRKAETPLRVINNKIIDYAFNDNQSDFLDIYIGFRCEFCITTGAGWDNVPSMIFRKPVIFTNLVPFGRLSTYSRRFIITTKRHIDKVNGMELTMGEIFSKGLPYALRTSDFDKQNIALVENSAEEIKDATIEMLGYVNGTQKFSVDEEKLQNIFWEKYSQLLCAYPYPYAGSLHGEYKARFSSKYLVQNKNWVN